MRRTTIRKSLPLPHWKAIQKAPKIEGYNVSTRRVNKFDRQFNRPMVHIYYKPKDE